MAKFSKQDYLTTARLISKVWSKLYALASGDAERQWGVQVDMDAVVTAFADMFQADDPRFDRQQFGMACEGEIS